MAKSRITVDKLKRIRARTRLLVFGQRVLVLACGLAGGFVVVAAAFPQKRVLDDLVDALAEAEEREQEVLAEREHFEIELKALREDPAFLEIHARDRLDFYREGERILKFRD